MRINVFVVNVVSDASLLQNVELQDMGFGQKARHFGCPAAHHNHPAVPQWSYPVPLGMLGFPVGPHSTCLHHGPGYHKEELN